MNNQQITIIGGMGPQASLNLHSRLLKHAVKHGAENGDDFPAIRHLSLPVKDFIGDPAGKTAALDMITKALAGLYLWRGRADCSRLQHGAFAFATARISNWRAVYVAN